MPESNFFQNIPEELKTQKRWLYTVALPDPGKKDKKMPFGRDLKPAKWSNPTSWMPFPATIPNPFMYDGRTRHIAGVQFVITNETGIVFIDLDHARNPETGQPEPWAKEIIDALNSYTEISASGTGYHIFVFGTIPRVVAPPSNVEMYCDGKLASVTGKIVGLTTEIAARDLSSLFARAAAGEFIPPEKKKAPAVQTGVPLADESAEDFRLICGIQKLLNTTDADAIEKEFQRHHGARYEKRNAEKKGHKPNYIRYSIENLLKNTSVRVSVAEQLPEQEAINPDEVDVLPPFPTFTGSLAELAGALTPDIPYVLKFVTAMTLFGGALAGRVHLDNAAHIDPRFYSIMLDVRGAGKGASYHVVRQELNAILRQAQLEISLSIDSGPALVLETAKYPKLCLYSDELSSLFEKAKLTGSSRNSLFTELLTLHDGHETENTTKGNMQLKAPDKKALGIEAGEGTIRVNNAQFCLLGGVQPDMFAGMWAGTQGGSLGLQSRFGLYSSGNLKGVPEPQLPHDAAALEKAVARLQRQLERFAPPENESAYDLPVARNTIHVPDAITQAQREWFRAKIAENPGINPRLPAYISRLNLILAVTNGADEVTSEIFQQAIAGAEYQIAMHAKFMPPDTVSWVHAFEDLIVKMFIKHEASGLSFNNLRRYVNPEKHRRLGGYGPFLQAFRNLESSGRVVNVEKTRKGGIYVLVA